MISILLMGAAAALPGFKAPIVRFQDYPEQALRKNEAGRELLEFTVSSTGDVLDCHILVPSQFPTLDEAACNSAKRAKAHPATDQSGQPIYAVVKEWIGWNVKAKPPSSMQADAILPISKLPEGINEGAITKMILVVDERGKVESCDIAESSGSFALDKAACAEVTS